MTQRNDFKKLVRARMAKTGEAYTTARMMVSVREPRDPPQLREPDYLETQRQFEEENIGKWKAALRSILGPTIPDTRQWTDPDEICAVLSQLGALNLNHTFLPSGGGLDLTGAQRSREAGCIELLFAEEVTVVHPRSLTFQAFPPHWSMSYFRLELDLLEPTDAYRLGPESIHEELTEIAPGKYEKRSRWDYDDHEPGWRLVSRYLRGTFVIFANTSLYNNLSGALDAYDARHNRMSAAEFAGHVSQLIRTAVQTGVSVP